jgi:hypothetical protein
MPRHLLTPRSGVNAIATPYPTLPMTPSGGIPTMPAPVSPASRVPFAAALIGAAAVLGVALVSVKLVKSAPPVPSASAAAPAPATFEVRPQVVPETAIVEIDGTIAGTGSVASSFPRDGKRHTLRASASGYEPASLEFDETTPPPRILTLRTADEPTAPDGTAAPPGARLRPGAPAVGGRAGGPGGARPGTRTDNIDPWKK